MTAEESFSRLKIGNDEYIQALTNSADVFSVTFI